MTEFNIDEITTTLDAVPELPAERLVTFVRLWQLETWLRQMVYVELRAKYGDDWSKHIKGDPNRARTNDEALTHMPTPEKMDLSFITFGALTNTISNEWYLFEKNLLPQNIWNARIEEVSQVRNRIAHFRKGHTDDYQRLIQLIRDVDKGFFNFCTSLNESIHLSIYTTDSIIREFAALNPYIRHSPQDSDDSTYTHFARYFEIRIEIVKRFWVSTPQNCAEVIGNPGFFYDLNIHLHNQREFRYEDLLKSTKSLHSQLLYVILDSLNDHLRVLIPSLLGKETLIGIIDAFIHATANNSSGRIVRTADNPFSTDIAEKEMDRVQSIADKWPEYVIGPKNPIAFLASDMECSFFTA